MIIILAGTNRPDSRSLAVSKYIKAQYDELGVESEIMALEKLPFQEIKGDYKEEKPKGIEEAVERLLQAEGLVVVCPEYNGSMPGALKYFIDHWKYPDSFEHRPVAFVGLGGMFGGLRPVEHLQQVFGYRNAFIYPDRVFMMNVWNILEGDTVTDERTAGHLKKQAQGFCRFIKALKSENLHGGDAKP